MPMLLVEHADLPGLYNQLNQFYGHQAWWPAKGRFEILIGAILVQNTAWTNVESAIENLRQHDWLQAEPLLTASESELHNALRPSGSFRVKTKRLLNLCHWFASNGGFEDLEHWPTDRLRKSLLEISGVGAETADAILVYAFDRPVFVIDAYTRRLLTRLGWLNTDTTYEGLRSVFELTLPADSGLFGQYHALIVEHAKRYCRVRPLCEGCFLNEQCAMALRNTA